LPTRQEFSGQLRNIWNGLDDCSEGEELYNQTRQMLMDLLPEAREIVKARTFTFSTFVDIDMDREDGFDAEPNCLEEFQSLIEGIIVDFSTEQKSFSLPELTLDLENTLLGIEKDDEDHCSADVVDRSPEGDCCCEYKKQQKLLDGFSDGQPCLRYEPFETGAMLSLWSRVTNVERCTCCPNRVYSQCGDTDSKFGYCGSTPPVQRRAGGTCDMAGLDCQCEGDLRCGKVRQTGEAVCCADIITVFDPEQGVDGIQETYCAGSIPVGEQCPWSNDATCADGAKCALRVSTSLPGDYICCEETFSVVGDLRPVCL
jgi:hypothetical protein